MKRFSTPTTQNSWNESKSNSNDIKLDFQKFYSEQGENAFIAFQGIIKDTCVTLIYVEKKNYRNSELHRTQCNVMYYLICDISN